MLLLLLAIPLGSRGPSPQEVYRESMKMHYGDVAPYFARAHSQYGQEIAVLHALNLKRGGYFVDMAANHPFFLSNTASLEAEYGWKGACIDAAMSSQRKFTNSNRTCNFRLSLAGIPRGPGGVPLTDPIIFRELEPQHNSADAWMHGLSSIVKSEGSPTCWGKGPGHHCMTVAELERRHIKTEHHRMVPRGIDAVLDEANAPRTIDYMSLDCEGHETIVLRGLERQVRALTIERPDAAARYILLHDRRMVFACEFWYGEQLWLSAQVVDALLKRGGNATLLCPDGINPLATPA